MGCNFGAKDPFSYVLKFEVLDKKVIILFVAGLGFQLFQCFKLKRHT